MSFNQLFADEPQPEIARSAVVLGDVHAGAGAILAVLRQHQTNLTDYPGTIVRGPMRAGGHMGTLYAYRDKTPSIGAGTLLFDSAEITGDVVIGEDSLIGAGGRSSATPTAPSASAPGSRSWRTRCCTCCPTTN